MALRWVADASVPERPRPYHELEQQIRTINHKAASATL